MPQLFVPVFDENGEVIRHISKRHAFSLIADSKLAPRDPKHPTDISKGLVFVRDPRLEPQTKALHEYAILKRKSTVVGGLTRTETKPIDRFKNSR